MDLPHQPTSPQKIYEAVTKEVNNLWAYIQARNLPGFKVEITWKKQEYGAWCTVRWFPKSYCHCKEPGCFLGKYVVKETHFTVKSDFSLEAFCHFIVSEKSWIDNFAQF